MGGFKISLWIFTDFCSGFWSLFGGVLFLFKSTSVSMPSTSISKPPPPYAREKVKSRLPRRGSDFKWPETLKRLKKGRKSGQIGKKVKDGIAPFPALRARISGPSGRISGPSGARAPEGPLGPLIRPNSICFYVLSFYILYIVMFFTFVFIIVMFL